PSRAAQHELETVDRDLPGRALDLEAPAGERVERHAVTLERRVHGRHLLLAPREARGERGERGLRERRDGRRVDRRAGAVERVGRGAEADRALVRLLLDEEIARHLGRLAEAEREEAARERVERAQVSDLGVPAPTVSPSVRTYTRATRRSADMRTAVTVRSRSRGSFASRRKTVASSACTRWATRSGRRSAIAPGSESVNESPDRAGRPRRPQRKAPPNRYRRGIA